MMEEIMNLNNSRFTHFWRKINEEEQKDEGEYVYPPNFLDDTDDILDNYITKLTEAVRLKDVKSLTLIIKSTVIKFNELNEKYGVIHTVLRDDICNFINKTAQSTSLVNNTKRDLTEEWRKW